MKRLIVGAAGHIDHGKTALIKALTGFDGDETAEEKSRQITMDLSFSHLTDGVSNIAFIDTPGHEKLIKNMAAGAFCLDALMLVVAADDGVMPQTIEHLRICDALGVQSAIAVITKIDKVTSDRVLQVRDDTRKLFETIGETALIEVIACSIYQAETIEALKRLLFSLVVKERVSHGFFRYYCDRVFVAKGAGVVVTGTVLDGEVKQGDKLHVCDLDKEVIARGIEVHNTTAGRATIGCRAALNLKGVEAAELKRGVLLASKGFMRGFNKIGIVAKLIGKSTIAQRSNVELCLGANRFEARITIIKTEGEVFFADLVTTKPVFAVFGDRFILRASAMTVAGGEVLLPIGDPMRRDQRLELMQLLRSRDFAGAFALLSRAHNKGFGLISASQRFGLSHFQALEIAAKVPNCFLDRSAMILYGASVAQTLRDAVLAVFEKNRRALMSDQTIAARFKWASRAFVAMALQPLVASGALVMDRSLYRHPQCDVKDAQAFIEESIYECIDSAFFTPQAPYNIYDQLDLDRAEGDAALKRLTKQAKVARLEHNLFVSTRRLQEMMRLLREMIKNSGGADVQSVKTAFNLSRKYAVCYLEYLDRFSDIKRENNTRVFAN
ncbi:MAG: selenocysteine-specific translation elongation factor [Helicobacteraceae bacterium]|jgi:selenocysteine-specific elongation factor|nr:selenocysteine-specific translation elongation factor [Helicobacteraceae bacterium]